MKIQTILNQFQKYSSFVYGKCKMVQNTGSATLEVEIIPRKNGKPECSQCGRKGSVYDHQPTPRRFDFVPFWGIAVVARRQLLFPISDNYISPCPSERETFCVRGKKFPGSSI